MSRQPISIEPQEPSTTQLATTATQRRRAQRRTSRSRLSLNLTAMIDVVFLLLIYFLAATQFKLGEEVYRLDLPPSLAAAVQHDPFELDREPLRIAVSSTGPGPRDYQLRLDGPYEQPSTLTELQELLRQYQLRAGSPTGIFEPDHPIIIQPTADARWDHAMAAFNAAAKARYTNITFAPVR